MFRKNILILGALLIGWGALPDFSRADDRYYLLMFAAQTQPNMARYSHTFALFVKVSMGTGQIKPKIEAHSISWMPRSLAIEPLRATPVPGVNLKLAQSLQWARSVNATVSAWGPYPIRKELFDMAVRQEARLNSNAIAYIARDRRYRGNGASNCIHAVSDVVTTQAPLTTGTQFGNAGSAAVLNHLHPFMLANGESTTWLAERLNLQPGVVTFMAASATAQ